MNIKKTISLFLILIIVFSLSSCKSAEIERQGVKVTFELEGGQFLNSMKAVDVYYNFKPGTENKIFELTYFKNEDFVRPNYTFIGWYKTKKVNGDKVSYEDPWDFSNDTVGDEGVTLYAYWKKNTIFKYDVGYYENDAYVSLGSYEVLQGDKFEDIFSYANKRFGYTSIGYFDEQGNPWDESFVHPGGDESLTIKVVCKFIEGDFEVVRTASDLKKYKNKNIWLANDIDLEGAEFSFGDYKGIIVGNGHTIKNFKLSYVQSRNDLLSDLEEPSKKSVYISLFGMANGCNVSDINFENVIVDVNVGLSSVHKIYFAAGCIKPNEATFKNVSISYSLSVSKLPNNFSEENLVVVETPSYVNDEKSIFENFNVNKLN